MSITATQLTAKVSAEGISETKSALSDVGASATATGGIFRSALSGALSLASNAAGQALGFLKDQFVDSVKIAMNHQQVMAQTAQAIKSTGGASGETAQAIDDLAGALSRSTDFSHDAIQSGENLLLTFTGIGKDVFPQVTSTMLDMAQAMGGDTKGAALQLGKALNDPATGLTALTRVGVTFSDQQKQQIKDMVAVGDTAGAQKVMLAELQKEFGGSAEAAGKTLPGALAILKNNFDDIKEKIGSAVIPVLASFAGFVSEKALPVLENFAGWFSANLGPAVQRVGSFIQPVITAFSGLGNVTNPVRETFENIGHIISYVGSQFGYLMPAIQQIVPPFENLAKTFLGTLVPAAIQVRGVVIDVVQHAFEKFAPIIERIVPPLIQFGGVMAGQLSNAIKFFTPYIVSAAKEIGTFASGLIDRLAPIATNVFNMISTAVSGFGKFWGAVWPTVSSILKGVWDEITGIIQIAWSIVSGIINIGLDILSGNWSQAWKDVQTMLSGVWEGIKKYLSGAWEVIKTIFSPVVQWFTDRFNDAKKGITGAFGSIGKWFGDRYHDIQGAFANIGGWFHDQFQNAWTSISNIFGNIGKWFSDRFTDIKSSISSIGGDISAAISAPFNDAWNTVSGIFGTIGQGINDLKSFNITAALHDFHVPGFAMGTDFAPGGLAIVGERGPELVNLPRGSQVIPSDRLMPAGTQITAQSSQQVVHVHVTVQPNDLVIDGNRFTNQIMPYVTNSIRSVTGARI